MIGSQRGRVTEGVDDALAKCPAYDKAERIDGM